MKRKRRPRSALKETSRDAQRRLILAAAARLVAEKPEGFNMRELAAAVGASTMVLYSLFGSREQIIIALFEESVGQLGDEMEKVTGTDPFARLVQLAYVYRSHALESPHYLHAVNRAPKAMGVAGARIRESKCHGTLIRTVQECIDAGIFAPGDARAIADILWTVLHGVVSLEAAGYCDGPVAGEAHFRATGEVVIGAFLARKT